MSELFEDIEGVKSIVDDLLIWGKDDAEHDARLKQVLYRAREVNLKFNSKKCQIRQEEAPYVGHVLSKEGLKPDPENIRAVQEMQPPENTKELKSFHGFQYLTKFMPNMASESAPLRELLEKQVAWHWDQEQETSFQKLKQMVSSTPVLGYYDPSKPLTISVDASSKGLGAVLFQDEKPLAYASRALTPAQQQHYAQIEKETLAIVYGVQKFHQFTYGRPTEVESDHKPLQYTLNRPLHQAPLRLQKMMLTLQRYDLKVKYRPGPSCSKAV